MLTYLDFRPTRRLQDIAAVSPDGTTAAYVDDSCGQFNLVVQRISDGTRRQLTESTEATVREAVWHPDGQSLVYLADTNGNENAQIYRVGLEGDQPEPLTAAPDVQHVLAVGDPLSPDGGKLAYAANDRTPGDQDVLVKDLNSGEVRRVYAG